MKFEKFLKGVGTLGEVVEINKTEKWLIRDGIGMRIPENVDVCCRKKNNDYATIAHVLSDNTLETPLELTKAVLLNPADKANKILRVFENLHDGIKIAIRNCEYELLEVTDQFGYEAITCGECDEVESIKLLVVFDQYNQVIGYITGSELCE